MLIPKDRSLRAKLTWPFVVASFIAVLVLILFLSIGQLKKSVQLRQNEELPVVEVQRGNFEHAVAAFGTLISSERRSLVTQVAGSVSEIQLQAGSPVTENAIILTLANPQLTRDFEMALLAYQEAEADFMQLQAELKGNYLTLSNEERMLLLELRTQEAELDARIALAEQNIVSRLELRREQMRTEQARLLYQLALERKEAFVEDRVTKLNVGNLRLERAKQLLTMAENDLEQLSVRAGMVGVLQNLSDTIELGQWLNQGETIGVAANLNQLYAELRVSASNASEIAVGMPVRLDIRGQPAEGEIIRVAPHVLRNQVQVDVLLTTALPITARPNLDVTAEIILLQQTDVLMLPRPSHFEPQQPLRLYLYEAANRYKLVELEVHSASSKHIAIQHGLKAGDRVLLSNPERWNYQTEILLN